MKLNVASLVSGSPPHNISIRLEFHENFSMISLIVTCKLILKRDVMWSLILLLRQRRKKRRPAPTEALRDLVRYDICLLVGNSELSVIARLLVRMYAPSFQLKNWRRRHYVAGLNPRMVLRRGQSRRLVTARGKTIINQPLSRSGLCVA